MSDERVLRADCARCCGLCCTAQAFHGFQGFGYDKPAHEPCVYLGVDHRCAIHEHRDARGFTACRGFDCFGAGQWVTQRLFGGRSWRDGPDDACAMFSAYARFKVLHELLATVELAASRVTAEFTAPLAALVEQACEREAIAPGVTNLPALVRSVRQQLAGWVTLPTDGESGSGRAP